MAKVLIEDTSLKAIADAIRTINGTATKYTPTEMATAIQNIMDSASYILVDETGKELAATYVDTKTAFDATANDIREGKTAATDTGITLGTKKIPSYNTSEGAKLIPVGSRCTISMPDYEYTKMQAIFCLYNTSLEDSVSAEKVSIDDRVYAVRSMSVEYTVVKDAGNECIDFGFTNTLSIPLVIRYFSYKEIY